jgi:hypothetical protein
MARKTFVDGDRWMAADAQLVMDQSVMFFTDAAQRDAQIPAPAAGMVAFLSATNSLWVYRSGAWVEVLSTNGSSSVPASEWPLPADILNADTTPPSMGNAIVGGYYAKLGPVHRATLRIAFGTGTTYGTGPWWIKLPRNCGSSSYALGFGYYILSSTASTPVPIIATRLGNDRFRLITASAGSILSAATGAWGNGGAINLQLDYF